MDPVTKNINTARSLLASSGDNLKILLGPELSQWLQVNYDGYATLLEALKVPKNIKISLLNYKNQLPQLPQRHQALLSQTNEIDKHYAEKKIDLVKAESESLDVIDGCTSLCHAVDQLMGPARILIDSTTAIRQNLSLKTFLPKARLISGSKEKLFDAGIKVFTLITDDEEESSGAPNINDYYAQTKKYEASIKKIDLKNLPALAATIVDHYVGKGLEIINYVKLFIETQNQTLEQEIAPLKKIRQDLAVLKNNALPVLLKGAQEAFDRTAEEILTLSSAQNSCYRLERLPALIVDIRLYYLTVKTDLLKDLQEQVTGDAPLNPAVLAATMAEQYLSGIGGILLIVRFLLKALLGGGKMVSILEIQEKIVRVLNSCRTYYGTDKDELQHLMDFLDRALEDYDRPFPYDSLYKQLKTSISTYGAIVENFVKNYEIKNETETEITGFSTPRHPGTPPVTLLTVLERMQQRVDDLKSIR